MEELLSALQPLPLQGRVALVTGVGRRNGIGFAVARRLAQLGADLFIQSWAPFDVERGYAGSDERGEVSTELRSLGTKVDARELDFIDPIAPRTLIEAAVGTFGHVDILVLNHAYSSQGHLEELTAEEIDKHLAVNVRASLLLLMEWAERHDDTRPGGRVILMTSGQHLGPMPGELAYVASKGALHQLTRSLSTHLAPRGITVNTVNPGPTDTGWADSETYRILLAASPQGRWGQPDDAARLIAWLATDDARWVTGQVINSTGGFQ